MKKLKDYLEEWIRFEIHETETDGIYQIYSGICKDDKSVDLSNHGFNLYFGNSKSVTKNYYEYGFNSIDLFKRATVLSLYYVSKRSAEEIVVEYIINAIRKGKPLRETNVKEYIWEGKSEGCPERWSIYIDLRTLE